MILIKWVVWGERVWMLEPWEAKLGIRREEKKSEWMAQPKNLRRNREDCTARPV